MSVVRWAFRVGSWHPTEQEWLKAASYIQAEEKERIGKFVFRRDAKSSMIGRLLIRKFVQQATSARYQVFFFSYFIKVVWSLPLVSIS
jgi:4'-phosphopantetheinyl transferase